MSTPLVSCIGLAGPTASGKSAASLAVAQRWPVEIISVDSALVYRGMDIGTAKPSAAELAQVPHHLINILDPLQSYSAADFVRDTTRLVGEINGRGRTALLVGGTMLYFKALVVGLDDMPPANAAVRSAIDARAAALGWPALHAELARVDPVTAARLAPLDAQRIQRALEVHDISGQPLSSFQTGRTHNPDSPLAPEHLISLEPHDRAWLHARIAQRLREFLRLAHFGGRDGQAHDGAPAAHRLNPRNTELDRFLHDPVHLVRRGQALHQRDPQRRLPHRRTTLAKHRAQVAPLAFQSGFDLETATVEQGQRVACRQAQHAFNMVGDRSRQREHADGFVRQRAEEARIHRIIIGALREDHDPRSAGAGKPMEA